MKFQINFFHNTLLVYSSILCLLRNKFPIKMNLASGSFFFHSRYFLSKLQTQHTFAVCEAFSDEYCSFLKKLVMCLQVTPRSCHQMCNINVDRCFYGIFNFSPFRQYLKLLHTACLLYTDFSWRILSVLVSRRGLSIIRTWKKLWMWAHLRLENMLFFSHHLCSTSQ